MSGTQTTATGAGVHMEKLNVAMNLQMPFLSIIETLLIISPRNIRQQTMVPLPAVVPTLRPSPNQSS
jgi:hypothetical protein